jgi:hypothetical protein
MATTLPATGTVTFTVTRLPKTEAAKKTLARLMRMNPRTQAALKRLSHDRAVNRNVRRPRAGRIWISRARATRVVAVDLGQTFTLRMTPQIMPDVRSVIPYLTVKT